MVCSFVSIWVDCSYSWLNIVLFHVILQVQKVVDLVKAKGGKVTREPGPVKGGKSIIAFVEDPDGYKFELIQRPATPEPFCQVMLRVGDLDRAVQFYEKVLSSLHCCFL
jgi:catechol 2,3-dioxygenase-like lactoylglutathione lyase family enzyme